ncbi:MAG: DUF5671 domain-containing protein [Patescibacteria group bacterium]
MDKPRTTAKDFFLWAGAIVAFYWSVIAYAALLFDYINYSFPNALSYLPANPYESGISFEMASVVVLFPIYLLLMWLIHKDAARDPSRNEIWVRRWALIFTLFLAGLAMAGDLIALLSQFFSGEELTTAFVLKVLVIFLLAAGVFMHFVAELSGYWERFSKRRDAVRIGVVVLVVVSIGAGFFIVGTPAQARLARFDAQKVSDLQNIQSQVLNYYQAKRALPAVLADLNSSINYYGPIPLDPQTNTDYEYQPIGALSFKLCAEFNKAGTDTVFEGRSVPAAMPMKTGEGVYPVNNSWQHDKGRVCFNRIIDPSFYPPLSKN